MLDEKARINRVLNAAGLASLADPNLMAQLGYLVEDHEHFRQLITKCQPAERSNMYNALAPNLRFRPKPLDVYIAETGQIAEVRQLPTLDPQTGALKPFRPPELEIAQKAIGEVTAAGHLTLHCRKCTRTETFPGTDLADAIRKAREAGWTYNEVTGDGKEICPKCPAVRAA